MSKLIKAADTTLEILADVLENAGKKAEQDIPKLQATIDNIQEQINKASQYAIKGAKYAQVLRDLIKTEEGI